MMKHLLIITIAAVLLVGCGPSVDIWGVAETGNIEAVKQHLNAGVDINAKGQYGMTSLNFAVWYSRKEIVELLIAKGANVIAIIETGDFKGKTSLDFATNPDNPTVSPETVGLLRKHGGKTSEELKAEGKMDGNLEIELLSIDSGKTQ